MITEWIIGLFERQAVWLLSLLPEMPNLDFAFGLAAILAPVSGGLQGLGGWIPWPLVNFLLVTSVSLYILAFVLRIIKSLIPTISG